MMGRRAVLSQLGAIAAVPSIARAAVTALVTPLHVDCHAHVFERSLPLAERRRYSVDYDATPAAYVAMLAANGMERGILVQPSFLGFDNRYLLRAIALRPDALRGISALDKATSFDAMRDMAQAGIVGIRLNLIGRADPELQSSEWRRHLDRVAMLGWQVEVQCEAARLPRLLPALVGSGVRIVIDHFGRPDAKLGVADPGFSYLLDSAGTGRVWVKLSGAYRVGAVVADKAAPLLLAAFGPRRLVWGSDWPHTQFEREATPFAARASLDRWVPDLNVCKTILSHTPAALFGFDAATSAAHSSSVAT